MYISDWPSEAEVRTAREERLKEVATVRGLRQQLTEEIPPIRRNVEAALTFYSTYYWECVPERIKYGWKGQLYGERKLDHRIVRGLSGFVRKNLELTEWERVNYRKYHKAELRDAVELYLRQLYERFPPPVELWEKLSYGARVARPH